mmetsp:Transcript_73668/g.195971  ORF Transcript_73668/g.195971 Transcript_73668/m.195971 type:complete len:121 (-) Transcript_73668:11-373(-)
MSLVTKGTEVYCDGLRGVITIGDDVYEFESARPHEAHRQQNRAMFDWLGAFHGAHGPPELRRECLTRTCELLDDGIGDEKQLWFYTKHDEACDCGNKTSSFYYQITGIKRGGRGLGNNRL